MNIKTKASLAKAYIAILSLSVCAVSSASEYLNYEGLAEVKVPTLDHAQVRPDVVFSVYTGIVLADVKVAFRTPDRSAQEFPLSQEQHDRLQATLMSAFTSELVQMEKLQLVQSAGRDVLKLSVRVQDVTATIPPRDVGGVGRAAIALRAVGEATLVLELYDSRSGEILARAVDTKAVEGAAIAEDGGIVTRWEGVEQLCARWASTTRVRLETLIGGR